MPPPIARCTRPRGSARTRSAATRARGPRARWRGGPSRPQSRIDRRGAELDPGGRRLRRVEPAPEAPPASRRRRLRPSPSPSRRRRPHPLGDGGDERPVGDVAVRRAGWADPVTANSPVVRSPTIDEVDEADPQEVRRQIATRQPLVRPGPPDPTRDGRVPVAASTDRERTTALTDGRPQPSLIAAPTGTISHHTRPAAGRPVAAVGVGPVRHVLGVGRDQCTSWARPSRYRTPLALVRRGAGSAADAAGIELAGEDLLPHDLDDHRSRAGSGCR